MFKSFDYNTQQLVDDDFVVSFPKKSYLDRKFPSNKSWLHYIVEEYKRRNLNIPKNVVLYCIFRKQPPLLLIETLRLMYPELKAVLAPYMEEIEKLSLLL